MTTKATSVQDVITASPSLEAAIAEYAAVSETLRAATRYAETRGRFRALEKRAAILRLMSSDNPLTGKPHSASSAEAIVESDAEYAAYLAESTEATLLRMHSETTVRIAGARVGYHSHFQLP